MNEGKRYNKVAPRTGSTTVENEDKEVTKEEVPDKKDLKQLVAVPPKKRKRNLLSRLVTGVLGPEGMAGIGQHVAEEIVIPTIKNLLYGAIESAARMSIFGDKGGPTGGGYRYPSRSTTDYRPRTNYTSQYTSRQPEPSDRRTAARPTRYGVEEYVIEDRYDASHVLTTLTESADMYDTVSVADYYDLIGVPSVYTDNTWGWTIDSISKATILPIRGGYVIKFPPVEVIG